ncbi:MAG: ATP-binding cassette domain-containing protein, partial [Myxococcales bacterium]
RSSGFQLVLLEARDLVVLREGRRILDGASLAVDAGEAVAVQGPSGSGKSTLVRTLATLIEPDSGAVLLEGRDAREIAPTRFRTRVAFLAQQPAMFAGTVRDNLEAGPALHGTSLADARARELVAAVGLDDGMLEREARSLSGGEKQRVALARALANSPDALLLDEPTASLDPDSGDRIVALLRSLCAGGITLLMVTHVDAHARALGGTRYRCERGQVSVDR